MARFGLNGLALGAPAGAGRSGVYQYVYELANALPAAVDDNDELVLFGTSNGQPTVDPAWIRQRLTPSSTVGRFQRTLLEHAFIPLATRKHHVDLVHHPAFAMPRGLGVPSVVTFHDLAFLRWPEQVPQGRYAYLSRSVKRSAEYARRLIAVSASTKRDMVEFLGVDADRVDVTPLGVSPSMKPATEKTIASLRRELNLKNPFILAVGNLEPRKNLASLIQAFRSISLEIPHDLVLAGPVGWKSDPLLDLLQDVQFANRVRLPGFVAQAQLSALYSAADVFVIPSWYEGFGLTLLEAMACGTPAITSNRGSLPEIAGDAALLIDPYPDLLAKGIISILSDVTKQRSLTVKGIQRSQQFSWKRTAELTVASYRRALVL